MTSTTINRCWTPWKNG